MTEYPPAKTEGYLRIYPNFQNCARCVKDLKGNKHDSLHLGRKYAQIFVLGHYLFLEARSFPLATPLENCSFLGTDNVRGQISYSYFLAKWRLSFIYFRAKWRPVAYLFIRFPVFHWNCFGSNTMYYLVKLHVKIHAMVIFSYSFSTNKTFESRETNLDLSTTLGVS